MYLVVKDRVAAGENDAGLALRDDDVLVLFLGATHFTERPGPLGDGPDDSCG